MQGNFVAIRVLLLVFLFLLQIQTKKHQEKPGGVPPSFKGKVYAGNTFQVSQGVLQGLSEPSAHGDFRCVRASVGGYIRLGPCCCVRDMPERMHLLPRTGRDSKAGQAARFHGNSQSGQLPVLRRDRLESCGERRQEVWSLMRLHEESQSCVRIMRTQMVLAEGV